MSVLDGVIPGVAASVIEQWGTTMTWRKKGRSGFNPGDGSLTVSNTDTVIKGVMERNKASGKGIDGNVIKGDFVVTTKELVGVAVGDEITLGTDKYKVVDFAPVYCGESVAVHQLGVER